MSFEGHSINRFEHKGMINRVHEEIKGKFDQDRIDSSRFDLNTVNADLEFVRKAEERFEQEEDPTMVQNKKLADILEYLVYFHGEQSLWLGDEAETIAPSRFDDIKNGVDVLVDFHEEGRLPQVAGLGIDATTSLNADILFQKLNRIKSEIESGITTEVRYFEDSNFKGSLRSVPKIIVSADQASVIRMTEAYDTGKNSELADDPFQYQLLEQILRQCEIFGQLADFYDQTEVANRYKFFAEKFKGIFEAKMREAQEKRIFEVQGDEAHDKLIIELQMINREIEKVAQERAKK